MRFGRARSWPKSFIFPSDDEWCWWSITALFSPLRPKALSSLIQSRRVLTIASRMLDLWGRVRQSNEALEPCSWVTDAERQAKTWNHLTWSSLDGGRLEAGKKLGPTQLISFWEVIRHFGTALGDRHNQPFWNHYP